jgi:hypothetical protein
VGLPHLPVKAGEAAGPQLVVNVAADRHPISPDIYGMNDNPWDDSLGKELRLPVSRWGGDATTCYNWQIDSSNSGNDWYFMGGGKDHPTPSAGADAFVDKIDHAGGKALLTVPVIDYINKATDWDCSFPVSLFGPQQKVNPYVHPVIDGSRTDAGNGIRPDGSKIVLTTDQILRTYRPNTPDFQRAWIEHMIKKYGRAAQGGVAIYQMDNEPSGWANTQRDIHPADPTYPEIVGKTLPYARVVKEVDPTAKVDGPGDFGWAVYEGDPKKNGGLGNAEYYLSQFRQASKAAGHRLLDYFDEHYYPIAQDDQSDAVRLQSTRSLWDPTYVEKDWIGKYYGAVMLIPRMHKWVNENYPGTKLAITEYNWGGLDTINGALAEADVLGIFGREGLDLATLWGPPKATDPGAFAFRIYRNYDGKGSGYGDVWVRSTSSDQDRVAIYASQRSTDHTLTLVIINKTTGDLTCPINVAGFRAGKTAQVYRYSAADLSAVRRQPDQPVGAISSGEGFTATYPASSITLMVIPSQ